MAAVKQAAPQMAGAPADRQRRARRTAYLGCAAVMVVRPLLRTLAWAGSLMGLAGVAGLIATIWYFVDGFGHDRMGGIHPATYLFVYVCFLVLGLAFGVTCWRTRRWRRRPGRLLAPFGAP